MSLQKGKFGVRPPHQRDVTRKMKAEISDASTSQETLKITSKPPGAGWEAWNRFCLKASEETYPADTLILGSWPLRGWDNTFVLFKPLSLWYFVLAGLANQTNRSWNSQFSLFLRLCNDSSSSSLSFSSALSDHIGLDQALEPDCVWLKALLFTSCVSLTIGT